MYSLSEDRSLSPCPLTLGMSRDALAKRMGLPLGSSSGSPSFPDDLQVIRELPKRATVAHNFAAPQPSNQVDDDTDVTYSYLCDGRALAHDGSAIVTDCLSHLLSINESMADLSDIDNLKGSVEIAIQTLNWQQNDARPAYIDWMEQYMGASGRSLGSLAIRLGDNPRLFGPILLTDTPQARLLRVWEQSVEAGNADSRWNLASKAHQSDSGDLEASSLSARKDVSTLSRPTSVGEAPNTVAHDTSRGTIRVASSDMSDKLE